MLEQWEDITDTTLTRLRAKVILPPRLAFVVNPDGDTIAVGELLHLSSCESGRATGPPEIDLWVDAERTRATQRAEGFGTNGDRCAGSAVRLQEVVEVGRAVRMKVLVVETGVSGWVTDLFAGKPLSEGICRNMFA